MSMSTFDQWKASCREDARQRLEDAATKDLAEAAAALQRAVATEVLALAEY